jgi:DUF917 family protein
MRKELVHQSFPLTNADLTNIVFGACFFASGGGGPVSMAQTFLSRINKTVYFINTEDLESGKLALMVADEGSPDAAKEGKGFSAPVNVYQVMANLMASQGTEISYLLAAELGAVNTLLPFFVASQLPNPIPVINGDPSGRAVPQLDMTLLDVASLPICPAAVASDTDPNTGNYQSQLFYNLTPEQLEEQSRDVVISYGGVGGLACYPVDGSQLNRDIPGNEDRLIQGSIGLCWNIGQQILAYEPLLNLQGLLNSFDVYNIQFITGTITDIDNRTAGGFDVGKIIVTDSSGASIWIYYKNESLLAWDPQYNQPRAMGPDGIVFVLAQEYEFPAGTPVTNADIQQGISYTIMGLGAFEKLRNPTLETLFLQNIQQVLAAFPEDHISITQYIPIQDLNLQTGMSGETCKKQVIGKR